MIGTAEKSTDDRQDGLNGCDSVSPTDHLRRETMLVAHLNPASMTREELQQH